MTTESPIIIVAGLGRCGTSLVMRILHAAGVPVVADHLCGGFEYYQAMKLPKNWQWLNGCHGKAVKIIDPHKFTPIQGLPYRIIWIDRDPIQQAKSQIKFLRTMGYMALDDRHVDLLSHKLVQERREAIAVIKNRSQDILTLRFEELITLPHTTITTMFEWLGVSADAGDLAKRLVVSRGTDCLPTMLEVDQLVESGT